MGQGGDTGAVAVLGLDFSLVLLPLYIRVQTWTVQIFAASLFLPNAVFYTHHYLPLESVHSRVP